MEPKLTIKELENKIQAAVEGAARAEGFADLLVPRGHRLRVSLRSATGLPLEGSAGAEAWVVAPGEIRIIAESPVVGDVPPKTGKPMGWSFKPVEIKGEPLSETVMRERR